MTDETVSLLRRRMIEDMTIRKFAPKPQHDFVQRTSPHPWGDRPMGRSSPQSVKFQPRTRSIFGETTLV
jgi:hypothetical protein